MPQNDPLSYIPDLFYRPQNYGASLGYANAVPDSVATAQPAPQPAPTQPTMQMPPVPQIAPAQAPVGFALREAMSPQALGNDPVMVISDIVRRLKMNDFIRTLLMSVVQVRPPNMGGR